MVGLWHCVVLFGVAVLFGLSGFVGFLHAECRISKSFQFHNFQVVTFQTSLASVTEDPNPTWQKEKVQS